MSSIDLNTVGQLATIVKIAIVVLVQVLTLCIVFRRIQIQKRSHKGDVSFKTYRQEKNDTKRKGSRTRQTGGLATTHSWH